jgi:DGQHR domain-containing protein
MSARALAANVRLASEVWEAKALDYWIQRILVESRALGSIASYLANHDDRFFNSIVVAALDGNPTFFAVDLADDPRFEMLSDKRFMDAFGVLRFDGTQQYYALDGQHRLRAIRALLENETDFVAPKGFEDEEFSVLIVVPRAGESREHFLKKYRRLFSQLNRYAKPMDKATTIVMEEDDAIAIATRSLISDDPFFSWVSPQGDPRIRAAMPENIRAGEPYFTTIEALYKANRNLLYARFRKNEDDWGPKGLNPKKKLEEFIRFRPEESVLDKLSAELALYWKAILGELPELQRDPKFMRTTLSADEDPGDGLGVRTNHLLFRPIGIEVFTRVVRELLDDNIPNPREPSLSSVAAALRGLNVLDWRLHQAPWRHLLYVYDASANTWRMRSEDRKPAVECAERVLRFMTGLDQHNKDTLEALKHSWTNLLDGCDPESVNPLWESVEEVAERFMASRET